MSSKKDHIDLIFSKGKYQIDCSTVAFSIEDIRILEKYGHWFNALESGELEPVTDMQREFIKVARGEQNPVSEYETTWFKYHGRKRWEAKYGNRHLDYHIEDDSFYNRDMAKKMKSSMFSLLRENHKR